MPTAQLADDGVNSKSGPLDIVDGWRPTTADGQKCEFWSQSIRLGALS